MGELAWRFSQKGKGGKKDGSLLTQGHLCEHHFFFS